MAYPLSQRIRSIAPSPTLTIDSKTKALIAAGMDIVNLTAGEPDFPTPMKASLAGIAAIVENFTKYTPAAGIPALRMGIAEKLQQENGLSYDPEEIIVSSGAKHSLYNVFMAILDPGDEVVLPSPYWVSYPEQIRLCGATPVIVKTDEASGFKMTPQQLRDALTGRTKAVLINSPGNPTGAMYTQEEIEALADVLEQHDAYVVSDEIYEQLTYDLSHYSIARHSRAMRDRTFVVNGFSKTHAMTGWRVGYVAAPKPLVDAMSSFQSHATAHPSNISQRAALGALGTFTRDTVEEFRRRRDFVVERLGVLPGIRNTVPQGAFYVFPNAAGLVGRTYRKSGGETTVIGSVGQLCELLLTDARISVVPGDGFGAPDNFRISYATSMAQLEKAMDRLAAFTALIE